MFSAVLLSVMLCACVVLWWRARVRESRAHPLPPHLPHQLPIIGHLHHFMTATCSITPVYTKGIGRAVQVVHPHFNNAVMKSNVISYIWETLKYFTNATTERGGVAYINLGPSDGGIHYCITDPEDALTVANTCLQKHFTYGFAQYWLGQGLITGSGAAWQRRRKFMNPIFSLSVLHGFLEVFNSQSKALLSTMEPFVGTEKLDLSSQIKKINLETSCLTVFGESDVTHKKKIPKYMIALNEYTKILVRRFQKFWLHNDTMYKLLGLRKQETALIKTLKDITNEILYKIKLSSINGTKTEANFNCTNTDIGYLPIVDRMLRHTNKYSLTDEEIREELDTTIVAAYDTSSTFFVNLLAVIGSYPEEQEKVYEEIMHVVGPDRDVVKEDLQKLVYTEAVLKEILRFLPAAPIIARYIDKDVKLKNYTLRAGSQCIIYLFGVNRHHSWGADADQFRPERWLDAATLPKNPNTFASFSIGKRSCIGRTYAMMSAKVMLAHVVRKYRLTADHTKMQFIFDVTLKSVAGHEIRLQRRN